MGMAPAYADWAGGLLNAGENALSNLLNAGTRAMAGAGIGAEGDYLQESFLGEGGSHEQYAGTRREIANRYNSNRMGALDRFLTTTGTGGTTPSLTRVGNDGSTRPAGVGPTEGVGGATSLALQNYAQTSGDVNRLNSTLSRETDQMIQTAQSAGQEMIDAYTDQTAQGLSEWATSIESQRGVGTDLNQLPPDDELVQIKNQFGMDSPEYQQALAARERNKLKTIGDKHTQLRTAAAAQKVNVIQAARSMEVSARATANQLKTQAGLEGISLTSNAAAGAVRAMLDDSTIQLQVAQFEQDVIGAMEASETQAAMDAHSDYINSMLIPAEYRRAGWQTLAGIQFQPAGWGRAIQDGAQTWVNTQNEGAA